MLDCVWKAGRSLLCLIIQGGSYIDGQPADSNRYFLDLSKCLSSPQTSNQALMLTFSPCDKLSSIIRAFYQEGLCHGHLSSYIEGVMSWLLWASGPGVGEGEEAEAAPLTRTLLLARVGSVRKWCHLVSVQHAIWRVCHRDLKQRNYTRKRTRQEGIDIFWLQKGTIKPEELSF